MDYLDARRTSRTSKTETFHKTQTRLCGESACKPGRMCNSRDQQTSRDRRNRRCRLVRPPRTQPERSPTRSRQPRVKRKPLQRRRGCPCLTRRTLLGGSTRTREIISRTRKRGAGCLRRQGRTRVKLRLDSLNQPLLLEELFRSEAASVSTYYRAEARGTTCGARRRLRRREIQTAGLDRRFSTRVIPWAKRWSRGARKALTWTQRRSGPTRTKSCWTTWGWTRYVVQIGNMSREQRGRKETRSMNDLISLLQSFTFFDFHETKSCIPSDARALRTSRAWLPPSRLCRSSSLLGTVPRHSTTTLPPRRSKPLW